MPAAPLRSRCAVFSAVCEECCAQCSQKRLRPEPERIGSPMGRNKFKCPFCDCLLCARGGPRPPSTLGWTRSRCCSFLGALTLVGSFIVNAVHKTRFRILYICTHQIDIMKAPSRCSWRQAIFRCQRGWVGHNRDRGPRSGTWEKEKANMDRNG